MRQHCPNSRAQLVDFVDDELDAAAAARLAQHIETCPDCRRTVDRLRLSLNLAREVWDETATAIPPRAVRMRHRLPVQIAVAALAAALLLAVSTWRLVPGVNAPAPLPPVNTQTWPAPADVREVIAREGAAAQLLASAELLHETPACEAYACTRFAYIARVFPESSAGQTARQRLQEYCDERSQP